MTPAAPDDLVSIVMPVWRPHAGWFPAAVSSALAQTDCEFELIIVDDGNDPPVEPPIESNRLRMLRIEHGGCARARTAGTAAARGRWFRHVDADDVLAPDGTARLLNAIVQRPDAALVFGSSLLCDENLVPKRLDRCALDLVTAVDCVLGRFNAWLPAMLFPRRVVEGVGPWNEELPVSTDWDFVLRALDEGPGYRVPGVMFSYRMHAGSLSAARRGVGGRTARQIVTEYFRRHPGQRNTRIGRQCIRRVEAHELRDRLVDRTWWRSGVFWRGLLTDPAPALRALPALIRSSIPARLQSTLFSLYRLFRRLPADGSPGEMDGTA